MGGKRDVTEAPLLQQVGEEHVSAALAEESPAYLALREAGLLVTQFRRPNIGALDLRRPNTDASRNLFKRVPYYCTGVGCCVYLATHMEFTVPAGHVQKLRDERGGYHLAAPGMHNIVSLFWKREGAPVPLRGHIKHGDRTVCIVDQGYVGLAMDAGMPVLLPPGLHEWQSDTLDFHKMIDLEDHVIALGPYTLLTVDEGYSAVTQDNGKQVILPGGRVHFLTHRNHKFEKFMTLKVQTDELEKIQATSADNIAMSVTSTVNWQIVDVETAATLAAETMATSGKTGDSSGDIKKLRKDVLKQAVASLAAFIGSVNYSDSFHLAAAAAASASVSVGHPVASSSGGAQQNCGGDNPLFDVKRMHSAVESANHVTLKYGIKIISINIISANPLDQALTRALASGAVASAEALQSETAARGNAKAAIIEAEAKASALKVGAEAEAQATLIKARAAAEAERVKAEASKDAADLLSTNDVAVTLAKMERSAGMLGQKDKLILATEPELLQHVITRPDKLLASAT